MHTAGAETLPPRSLRTPYTALGPRVPALLASGRETAPRLRAAPLPCLPGSHSFPKPARCASLAPAPACPVFAAAPHYPGTPSPRLGSRLLPWPHFGVRPGVRVPAGRRGVADVPGTPGGPTGPAAGGGGRRAALRSPGTGRAPPLPARRGARPGNRQRPEPPGPAWVRNRHRAGLCSHLAYKIEPAPEAWGASPVAPGRAQQAGRSLLSKNAGVERKTSGKSLPEVSRLEEISPRRGSLRHGQDLISSCSL